MRKTLRLYAPYVAPVRNANATSVNESRIASLPQNADDVMTHFSSTNSVGWSSCATAAGTGATGPAGPVGPTGPAGYGLSADVVTAPGQTISTLTTTTLVQSAAPGTITLPLNAANGAQKTLVYPVNFVVPSTTVVSSFLFGGTPYTQLHFTSACGACTLVFSAALNQWVVADSVAVALS